ncbi:hypothetical protein, partial [Nocardia brasiliensis]|uniref:hypothetical protein n=1 Tax=Nocardia brasiliensis TaxID=37326 RepID=UPI002455D899
MASRTETRYSRAIRSNSSWGGGGAGAGVLLRGSVGAVAMVAAHVVVPQLTAAQAFGEMHKWATVAAPSGVERFALRGRRRVVTRGGPVDCAPAFDRYAAACAAWPVDRAAAV